MFRNKRISKGVQTIFGVASILVIVGMILLYAFPFLF